MKFTVKSTEGLKLPPGKTDLVVFDDTLAGFGLRLRAGGSRSWVFQYQVGDRQRRMAIGKAPALTLDKAREIAAQLHAKVKLGGDPAGDKAENQARAGETFEHCIKLYLQRRRAEGKIRPSTYGEIERHLTRNLKALHPIPIHKLDRRAIAVELAHLTEGGRPVQANRTRGSVVKFLNWCAGEGFIDVNPAAFTNKNAEHARDRVLKDDELRKVWHALPEGDYRDIIKLLALTGARANEIAQLRWSEIDFDRGVIALPASRAKNRRAHFIPMSATVRAILEAKPQDGERDLVFGRGQGGFSGWTKCKERLDAQVNIPPWVIHDLRRTVSTGMNEIGVSPWVVEAVLNHVSGFKAGVAGRYNHATLDGEKAAALARWDEHLMAAVEGRDSKLPRSSEHDSESRAQR
jgi:integrase